MNAQKDLDGVCTKLASLLVLCVALSLASVPVHAEKRPEVPAPGDVGSAVTVFLSVGVTGRKDLAAARMTELHERFFENHWTLVDVDPYVENGDLQGFFVTCKAVERVE